MTNQDIVLTTVLNCGTMDLFMLDDISYDLGSIVDELLADGIKPTLNVILSNVFRKGICDLESRISDRICRLELIPYEENLEDNERRELHALRRLNPEQDIKWYCNCSDTSIYFVNNKEIYQEYLAGEVSEIEDYMGFSIT